MQGENGERWKHLCEQAAVEQDPQRLLELVREINRLLAHKQDGIKSNVREEAESMPGTRLLE